MKTALLRAVIGTRADTKSAAAPAIPNYSALLVSRNSTSNIPSHTAKSSTTFLPEPKLYTGSAMVGISTMHKSNAVPVFNTDHAKEITRMRRGFILPDTVLALACGAAMGCFLALFI